MLYNYHFEIASIILTTALLLMYVLRRGFRTRSNWYFCAMLVLNLISSTTNLISTFTISYPADYPVAFNYLINCLFLMSHNLTGVTFFAYLCLITKGGQLLRFESHLWKILGAVVVLLVASTPFTHAVFYFDDGLVYTHGLLFPLLYVMSFFLLAYDLVLVLKYRKRLTRYQFVATLYFIIAVIVSLVVALIYSSLLMEDFAAAISLTLLYMTIENPADYMYKHTYCYNERALESVVSDHINDKRHFEVVGFAFDDVDQFSRSVDAQVIEQLNERLIVRLHSMYSRESVFCLGDLRFAVFVGPCTVTDSLIAKMGEFLKRNLHISNRAECVLGNKIALEIKEVIDRSDMNASPYFHIVSYPGFIDSLDGFNSALAFGLNESLALDGDRISYATRDSIDARLRENAVLVAVRRALKDRSFVVNYQPILRVKDGKFATAEVLIRLIDDELGFIPPDEFIPLAEANGLAPQISDFVIEETCRFWHDCDLSHLGVDYLEVNLSAMDFVNAGLEERLLEIMGRYGMKFENLNFEITETAATGVEDNMFTASMERLAERGVRFSVDDFGSGYASINYLIQVPAQLVKIDKVILWAAMEDDAARTVLSTTLSLVHQLSKKRLCEGVENEAMAEMLRDMGCEYFQGYLYSRPLSGEDYLQFLRDHQ